MKGDQKKREEIITGERNSEIKHKERIINQAMRKKRHEGIS